LRETAASNSKAKANQIDSRLVTERLTTRVEWMRSSVEALWKDPSSITRPDRYELVMDGNWWRWNLLLTLSPGLLIAVYCELVGKPMMLEQGGKSGFPATSSERSVLEDLFLGFQYYFFDQEAPLASKKSPETNARVSGSTDKQQELHQLQELKKQIQALEDKIISPKKKSAIHQRHQAEIQPAPSSTSSPVDSEQPSLFSIVQTLVSAFDLFRIGIESVFEKQREDANEKTSTGERGSPSSDDVIKMVHSESPKEDSLSTIIQDDSSIKPISGLSQIQAELSGDGDSIQMSPDSWWRKWWPANRRD
jgi:hypothetical protein